MLSVDKIENLLETKTMGRNLVSFEELDSTNTFCRIHGQEYPDGTLVLADNQTAGKGSRGRSWESPAGVSIYMSLILKPDMQPVYAPRLTLVMAHSVARVLRSLGVKAEIKWPNDLVVDGRKLVGILTEMNADGQGIQQVIVGIGINVLTREFPEELHHRATSLLMATGKTFSREELIALVTNAFEEDYGKFLETCDLSQLLEQYIQLSATVGKEVRILDPAGEYTGYAETVDETGQLLVRRDDGQLVKVLADEVSVRGIYGYV